MITLVRSTGEWGMLVFVLIQFLQVVVLPLPAVVCYVPGAVIWSPLTATLLASAGVIAGSFSVIFGEKIRTKSPRLVGGQGRGGKIRRLHRQSQQGNFSYYADSALFPDDVLCIIAGITAMNFPYFAGVIVLVRPLIIAAYCFLGNGSIIPFSGWGIPVWLAIIAVFATLAVLSFKYQKRFEDWLFSKFSRKKGKLKKEEKAQETIETEE